MTILGWDMSHFDAPSIGDAVSEGISFFTHKAGGDALDAELGAWWAGVKGLGDNVLLGAYWVLYPGNPTGRADAFLARLDSQCPGWRDRPFILYADCEQWGGDPGTVPSRAEIQLFCARLHIQVPKLKPLVYAPQWVYGDSLAGLGYPLWASSYVTGTGSAAHLYPGDASSRWAAYSGQVPAILQFTSSATIGGQTTCDANAYRGTLDDLTALIAPGWSTPMAFIDNQADFNTALTAWASSAAGKAAIGTAVARTPVDNARLLPDGSTQHTTWIEFDRYDDVRADRSDQLQKDNAAAILAAIAAARTTLTDEQLSALADAVSAALGGVLAEINTRLTAAGTALAA